LNKNNKKKRGDVFMLNKAELIARFKEATGSTKKEATQAVDTVLAILEEAVQNGEPIALTGYLKGEVRKVNPRTARNPQTGEVVHVPAKKKYVLKAGSRLTHVVEA
jgi:DNA-binding protein HU-beta